MTTPLHAAKRPVPIHELPDHHRFRRGSAFIFEWSDPVRVVIEIDRIRDSRDGDLVAELTAISTVPAIGGTIHVARVGLLSTRSLAEFAKACTERTPALGVDWTRLLSIAAREAVELTRRGTPPVYLSEIEPEEESAFLLEPLALGRLPTILFGDGGSGKSLLALAIAATIESGHPYLGLEPRETRRVAFLDYEFDAAAHADRLRRLAGPQVPRILYVECARPLADDVDRIRRILDEHQIGFVVVDSVGLACDGPPEAAEVAIRFFGALRTLGRGSLLVAHVNRNGDTERPFGSAFWHNGAKATWYIKVEHELGGTLSLGLFNKKSNVGPRFGPLGFAIRFQHDHIRIDRTATAEIPEIEKHLPLAFRIQDGLRSGARTIADLAGDLGADVETVARTLRRMRDRGHAVRFVGPDGVTRWGLAAREGAQ